MTNVWNHFSRPFARKSQHFCLLSILG